jgi:hypothetical protein
MGIILIFTIIYLFSRKKNSFQFNHSFAFGLFMIFLIFYLSIYKSISSDNVGSLPVASLPVASLPVASLPVASLPVASLKEGYTSSTWSNDLIDRFLAYQYYHNPNYIFDIDIIQKQASSEEAEDYLKNGKWKWSNEVEKLYTNYTYQLPFVSISSKTSIENSKKIYNETAITDLMAWNSKEGLFILNGAVIGHSPGLPKNINNQIKCNTKGQMMKIINRDIDIYPGYMIQEKKILPSEDIPKTLAGFQFIDEICNPCIQGGKQNCKFKLNIGDGGEISSIWEYIWGINKKNNKVSQNKVGVQPRNIEPLYDKPNLQVDLNF